MIKLSNCTVVEVGEGFRWPEYNPMCGCVVTKVARVVCMKCNEAIQRWSITVLVESPCHTSFQSTVEHHLGHLLSQTPPHSQDDSLFL